MEIMKIITETIKETIKTSALDFEHWYEYDFETDVHIDEKTVKTLGTTSEEIEESQSDFIYEYRNDIVEDVCKKLGISTDCSLATPHEKLLEELVDKVTEQMRKRFHEDIDENSYAIEVPMENGKLVAMRNADTIEYDGITVGYADGSGITPIVLIEAKKELNRRVIDVYTYGDLNQEDVQNKYSIDTSKGYVINR